MATARTTALIPDRATVAARYREAQRHSRLVRFLRLAIPIGSLLTIAGIILVAVFDPFRTIGLGLSIGTYSLSGSKITMELPHLTGFRQDMRPYEVTATSAVQDVRNPTVIELSELKAKIGLEQKGVADLIAAAGVYDSQKENLSLSRNVHLKSESYDVQMQSARIDFKAGTVFTDDPVRVVMTGGVIDADSMQIVDNGRKIVFTGRVKTALQSGDGDRPKAAAGSGPSGEGQK
jgi:lipopolysaccharide export system protein LptC